MYAQEEIKRSVANLRALGSFIQIVLHKIRLYTTFFTREMYQKVSIDILRLLTIAIPVHRMHDVGIECTLWQDEEMLSDFFDVSTIMGKMSLLPDVGIE